MPPVRVLIVDDSAVVRKLVSEALASGPEVSVLGTAFSGAAALEKIPQLRPDVVTLDIEMPGLNGLQTLAEIRKRYPKLPVIMFSTLTERGASVTLEALSLGASDYVTKPTNSESLAKAMEQVRRELVAKIVCLGTQRASAPTPAPVLARTSRIGQRIDVLAVGVSTGGPNALAQVIPSLPADFPVPIVIVQHMPPLFTRLLAERLNSKSRLAVREAEAGQILERGQVWIARGDYHLVVARNASGVILNLNQDHTENSCRPAVDVLFRSVAKTYGVHALAVVMTGMGSDGARGAASIREAGGEVFVQDEATSVVWGMPAAAVSAGAVDKICALPDLSDEMIRRTAVGREQNSAMRALGRA